MIFIFYLEVVRVQYYEDLTARAGSRIWQSVSTAHCNINTSIMLTVSLIVVQQLFTAPTVSLYIPTILQSLTASL